MAKTTNKRREIVMMPNGLVGSWLLRDSEFKILLTGQSEATTEEYGRKVATMRGVAFRRVASWRELVVIGAPIGRDPCATCDMPRAQIERCMREDCPEIKPESRPEDDP
jgi:hypothetical protein